jgi:hypothetical protein
VGVRHINRIRFTTRQPKVYTGAKFAIWLGPYISWSWQQRSHHIVHFVDASQATQEGLELRPSREVLQMSNVRERRHLAGRIATEQFVDLVRSARVRRAEVLGNRIFRLQQ